ncbi:hypothetical protein SK128_022560, partial [Halocaridina rubra]
MVRNCTGPRSHDSSPIHQGAVKLPTHGQGILEKKSEICRSLRMAADGRMTGHVNSYIKLQ